MRTGPQLIVSLGNESLAVVGEDTHVQVVLVTESLVDAALARPRRFR